MVIHYYIDLKSSLGKYLFKTVLNNNKMSFQDILLNGLNNLQSDAFGSALQHMITSGNSNQQTQGDWYPLVDIVDTKNNLYVYMELPGVVEDSISIDFFNNRVDISGEKVKKYTAVPSKSEITYGKFNRKIILPLSVTNKQNVSVQYNNGVLKLTVDKRQEEHNRFRIGVTRLDNINEVE